MTATTTITQGDCLDVLRAYPDNLFDLTVTSPPYADQRAKTYGGISPDRYVEWFLPRSKEIFRTLKPTGTFILNIKEKVVDGERHTYVLYLIQALRNQGWLWSEEYIWHKRNCAPGKWPNRFRDAWERCLQFNKQKHFNMYQDEVMVPMGDWAKSRLRAVRPDGGKLVKRVGDALRLIRSIQMLLMTRRDFFGLISGAITVSMAPQILIPSGKSPWAARSKVLKPCGVWVHASEQDAHWLEHMTKTKPKLSAEQRMLEDIGRQIDDLYFAPAIMEGAMRLIQS